MSVISFLAVYLVVWAIVLQAVLPFGVKAQSEDGEIVPGTDPSAPVKPMWRIKLLATTLIALVIWGILYWLIQTTGLGFR